MVQNEVCFFFAETEIAFSISRKGVTNFMG